MKARSFYPIEVYKKLKVNDVLDIGFNDLKAKIIKKNEKYMTLSTISSGVLKTIKE